MSGNLNLLAPQTIKIITLIVNKGIIIPLQESAIPSREQIHNLPPNTTRPTTKDLYPKEHFNLSATQRARNVSMYLTKLLA